MQPVDPLVHMLLVQTLRRFVAADAIIDDIRSTALTGGMSGSAVWRHQLQYRSPAGQASTTLITKEADVHEWQVIQHLQRQRQPHIPFAHTLDRPEPATCSVDGRLLICLQDVGDQNRPTSLEPISATELAREATALAAIHAANFNSQPAWLPSMNASYIEDMLFVRAWRPAWEAACADPRFASAFRDAIPRVEAAAATIVDDMRLLLDDPSLQTLIHGDLNPSNVLVSDGQPYVIDWQAAVYGPFYIDLPHHHCTLAQAEHYRQAMAAHGYQIDPQEFAERYRIAARYIGLRYMWWTLEYWLSDQSQTAWVQHYLGLVTGDGIGPVILA